MSQLLWKCGLLHLVTSASRMHTSRTITSSTVTNFIDVLAASLDFDISASHLCTNAMVDGLVIALHKMLDAVAPFESKTVIGK